MARPCSCAVLLLIVALAAAAPLHGSSVAPPAEAAASLNGSAGSDADNGGDAAGLEDGARPHASPACCRVLAPVLQLLQAPSLAALQLPVLVLSRDGQAELAPSRNRIKGSLCVCGGPNGTGFDWLPRAKAGVRGSTSVRDFARKSYKVDLKGGKVGLLGMPKGKRWALYAPEGDVAFIRNWLALALWRQLGRWGPRTAWAELFIVPDQNTTLAAEHYYGAYLVTEKIWRGKHRININKYDAAQDPTGGFIFRVEHGKPKPVPQVATRLTSQVILIDEQRKNVSDASLQYLTTFFNDFERQLLAPGLGTFATYAAPDALVDFFLASELVKSANDGYRGSVYFWKDANSAAGDNATESFDPDGLRTSQVDGRLVMGPVWDAAKAMGLCCGFPIEGYQAGGASNGSSGGSAISPEGWLFNICLDRQRCKIDPQFGLSQWYIALWKEPAFRANVTARYAAPAGRGGAWSDTWFQSSIDAQAALVTPAAVRTFGRWGAAYASDRLQMDPPGAADYPASFNASLAYLRSWTMRRLAWLDSQLLPGGQARAEAAGGDGGNGSATPTVAFG